MKLELSKEDFEALLGRTLKIKSVKVKIDGKELDFESIVVEGKPPMAESPGYG